MKQGILKAVFILFIGVNLALTINKEHSIESQKVIATFNGYDENGYTFSFLNEDDYEEVITFEIVSEKILRAYNLKDNKFIDKEFEITYDYQISDSDDEVEVPVLQTIKLIE